MVNSYLVKAFVCFDQNINEYQMLNEQYSLQDSLQYSVTLYVRVYSDLSISGVSRHVESHPNLSAFFQVSHWVVLGAFPGEM